MWRVGGGELGEYILAQLTVIRGVMRGKGETDIRNSAFWDIERKLGEMEGMPQGDGRAKGSRKKERGAQSRTVY